jgi:glycosyltransferase involved in cell wall biosynthesis
VVMLEAGASGLPVIGAGIEGILDVVREAENGHLVPSADPEAFIAVISRYERDRDALASLSRRAALYTRASFGWTAIADRFLHSLREKAAL